MGKKEWDIVGYKAMNKDHTNRYGFKFEVGKTYEVSEPIIFGNDGNGFHMCSYIEDTFRYFDTSNYDVSVALVKGSGKRALYNDEYYGYYDMYSFQKIKILKFLSRSEIIDLIVKKNNVDSTIRFIQTFKMTPNEVEYFVEKFGDNLLILKYLLYYQLDKKQVFDSKNTEKVLKMKEMLLNGQNNSKRR